MSKRDPLDVIYIVESIGDGLRDGWCYYAGIYRTPREARTDIASRNQSCRYRIVRYRRGGVVR